MTAAAAGRRLAELRGPLEVRDFRLLWGAQVASELGDWAARLALAVLVLERGGSAFLAGLVTTVSLLPWIGIGQVLAAFGDRFPRRGVLIVSDLVRAAVFAAMLLPVGVPVLLLLALVAGTATPLFQAARSALLPGLLPAARYGDGLAVTHITNQSMVIAGYLSGGGLVAAAGPRAALVVNACSFLASALLVAGIRGGREQHPPQPVTAQLGAAVRLLRGDPLLFRAAALVAVTSMGGTAAEALVAVYAEEALAGPSWQAGVLAATVAAGTVAAVTLIPRHGEHRRLLQAAAWVAIVASLVAVAGFVIAPPMPAAAVPFLAAGAVFAVIVPANAVVGTRVANERRAVVFGLLQGSLMGCQALAAAAAGWLAGAVGVAAACALAFAPGVAYAAFTLLRPPQRLLDDGAGGAPPASAGAAAQD